MGGSLEELNYTVLDTFHELESIAPDAWMCGNSFRIIIPIFEHFGTKCNSISHKHI